MFTLKVQSSLVFILNQITGSLYQFNGNTITFITNKPSGAVIKKIEIYDSEIYLDCGGDIYRLDSATWTKIISIYPGGNQLWTGYPDSPETHTLFPSQIIIQTENFGTLDPPHLFISRAPSFWLSDDGMYLYPYSNTYGTYDYVLSGGAWVYVDFYPYYEYFWIKGPGVPGELSDYIKEASTVTKQGSGNILYFSKTTTVEQDNLPETNNPYSSSGYANGNFYTYYAKDGYFRICLSGNSTWTKTITVPYNISTILSYDNIVFWSGSFYSGSTFYDEGTFIVNSSGTSITKINSNNYSFRYLVDFNGELYADRSDSSITYIEKDIYSATPTIVTQATLIPFDGEKYYLYGTDTYVISQQTIYKDISGELKWICGSPYNESLDSYYSELSDLLFSNSGRIYAWARGFDELYMLTDIGGPSVKIRVRNLRHKTSSTEERARGAWWKYSNAWGGEWQSHPNSPILSKDYPYQAVIEQFPRFILVMSTHPMYMSMPYNSLHMGDSAPNAGYARAFRDTWETEWRDIQEYNGQTNLSMFSDTLEEANEPIYTSEALTTIYFDKTIVGYGTENKRVNL